MGVMFGEISSEIYEIMDRQGIEELLASENETIKEVWNE